MLSILEGPTSVFHCMTAGRLPERFPAVLVWANPEQVVFSPEVDSEEAARQVLAHLPSRTTAMLRWHDMGHPFLPVVMESLRGRSGHWCIWKPHSGSVQFVAPPQNPEGFTFKTAVVPEIGATRVRKEVTMRELEFLEMQFGVHPLPLMDAPLPVMVSQVNLQGSWHPVLGRGQHYHAARTGAVLEALERQAADRAVNLSGPCSFLDMRQEGLTLDPRTLVQPEPAHLPEHWTAYHPELPIRWTRGFSVRHQQPISVPARHVFLSVSDPVYVQESSSGVALGTCREEALLHALLEVIERDAFLMTYYSRTPARRVVNIQDREVQDLTLQAEKLGFEVFFFNITQENGIPAVWALLKRFDGKLDQVQSVSGAAAHLQPLPAIRAALSEALTTLHCMAPHHHPEEALKRVLHPEMVQDDLDHFLRFAHPLGLKDLDFLGSQEQLLSEFAPFSDRHTDLTEPLTRLLQVLLQVHEDVVFVDLPAQGGFHAVRALVPGMLPMTFGHPHRVNTSRLLSRLPAGHNGLFAPHPFP